MLQGGQFCLNTHYLEKKVMFRKAGLLADDDGAVKTAEIALQQLPRI